MSGGWFGVEDLSFARVLGGDGGGCGGRTTRRGGGGKRCKQGQPQVETPQMEMRKSRARSITSDRGQVKEAGGSRGGRGTRRKNLHEGESEGKTEEERAKRRIQVRLWWMVEMEVDDVGEVR